MRCPLCDQPTAEEWELLERLREMTQEKRDALHALARAYRGSNQVEHRHEKNNGDVA